MTTLYPAYYHPKGGHITFPPSDCPYSHRFIKDGTMVWLDNGMCNQPRSKCATRCERYKQYYAHKEYEKELIRMNELRKEKK